MKIWNLAVETGKRDVGKQYQIVNKSDNFNDDFDQKMGMAKRLNGYFDDIEVDVICGRKDYDMSKLWNGACLYILNEKAKRVLEPILKESVEFIPVKNENSLYLMNVVCVADALDYKNIVADTYKDMIMYIREFAFVRQKLPDSPIFKVMCNGYVYVAATFITGEFKEIVEANHLTGFRFREMGDF